MSVRIGIIGTGETVGIAHFHTEGIKQDPRAHVAAVYDLSREKAQTFVSEHGLQAVVCESSRQLLELVDAVVICTPNSTHIPYVLEALRAGRAVFVEKPLSISPQLCLPVLEELRQRDTVNMMGFIYRYSNQMRALKDLIRSDMGRVYTFSASFGGKRLADPTLPLEWRMRRSLSGSGALGDFGSHMVDAASFTAGLRYDRLLAQTQTFIESRGPDRQGNTQVENDDAAVMIGTARNGALSTFVACRVGMEELTVTVTGEGGIAKLALAENDRIYYTPKTIGGGYAGETKVITVPWQQHFDGWFCDQMRGFIDALCGETSGDIADIAHGYYVEELLAGADEFAREDA